MTWDADPSTVRPMLATTAAAPLHDPRFAYEPKYDGVRALVATTPHGPVRLWSRLGNEKTAQFPDIVAAVSEWARTLRKPALIDGEIVALDGRGEPIGFQNLQGRIHLKSPVIGASNLAYVAFDLLREGDEDLRGRTLRERRACLEKLFATRAHPRVRISEQSVGDGRALQARAEAHGWEGLVAKSLDSVYKSGRRAPEWRKLKLIRRQTCVVAGWTEPRGSRPFFGALLLGVYDERGTLHYVGHSGAGFTDAELGRVWKRLHAMETRTSPFAVAPRTNEKPHWVQPKLVAEVKFTEWTADGKLRHPTYLGLRDDVDPKTVRKEPDAITGRPARLRGQVGPTGPIAPALAAERAPARPRPDLISSAALKKLLAQIDAIDDNGGNGVLELPGGERLEVTNLGKIFWPKHKLTKGHLLRHYVRVAPYILPVLADRPLVMKRYPNGVDAKPFYQHRAPDKVPGGVRVEVVETDREKRSHVIGGSLVTLLYTAQLASISQDPWFSRVDAENIADHVAIDLDPPDGVPFSRVLDVARWVREELDVLKAPGFPKTSGSGGLHVYVPMPPDTPYAAGLLFCQIVATMVARKHPKAATIERAVKARGSRVYVDYLQNIQGKTLASAYSPRANDFAGVSAPLTWDEIDEGVSPRDFTIRTFADRLKEKGDLWAALRRSKPADLRAVMKYAEP
jgi:bifunctional non-homologous end joining protein LigD